MALETESDTETGTDTAARTRTGPLTWIPGRAFARFPLLRQTEREARVWAQLWKGTVIAGVVNPLLFLGAMGLGLGSLVDDRGPVEGLGVRLAMDATAFLAVAALLGAVPSPWGVLAIPAAVAGGLAFAAPLAAFAARQDSDVPFSVVMRILVMPMFLFSGTFFPLDQLPSGLRPVAWVTPLWHAVELCRAATTGSLDLLAGLGHLAFLLVCAAAGAWWGVRSFRQRLTA
jgi:hypothetical protein